MPINFNEINIYDPFNAYLASIGDDRFRLNKFMDKVFDLPEKIYDFTFTSDMPHILKDKIVGPFQLNQEQGKKLAMLLMEIITADVYLGNIVAEVQKRLNISQEKAKEIANVIAKEIFPSVWEDLKKIHVERFKPKIKPQAQEQEKTEERNVESAVGKNIINLREES